MAIPNQRWDTSIQTHLDPNCQTIRSQGGKDEYKNLQLLHRHCHDDKTALDERDVAVLLTKRRSN
uniref:HNH endonuclease n=1 Tax=Limnospira platensis TaxID=118562 RepID=UPI003D6F6AC2